MGALWAELVDLEHGGFLMLQAAATALFFSLCYVEALLTHPRPPSKAPPELIADMWYWLLSPTVRLAARAFAVVILALAAMMLGMQAGAHLLHGFGPIVRQPTALILIELVLLMDLLTYWTHRLFHTVPWLWRFHAVHHSATTVRWSTAGRLHPVNEVINYSSTLFVCFLLGFPLSLALPLFPLCVAYATGAHANWRTAFGPLRHVLVSPLFHRWHHTLPHEGGNKNFANIFSFWDRLFGTYYLPDRLPTRFGLDSEPIPERYWAQLLHPFRPAPATAELVQSPARICPSSATESPSAVESHSRGVRPSPPSGSTASW